MFLVHWSSLLLACWAVSQARGVTVYGPNGAATSTATGTDATTSTTAAPSSTFIPAAFNTVTLTAPAIPTPPPPNQFPLALQSSAQNVPGLSIPHDGAILGFSIEMSVADQVVGRNSTYIQVPFLNLMSLIVSRSGSMRIRVGGNTQETAVIVDSLPNGGMIQKDKDSESNPTETPTLLITPELFYMMANVSSLVNVNWFLGIPFNDTSHPRLQIAEVAEAILGGHLIGFQMGNEPDFYADHGHRNSSYNAGNYANEFGDMIQDILADSNIPVKNNLIGPSVSGGWSPEEVWDTGFISRFEANLGALSVEHYPDNNCAVAFPNAGFGSPRDPQTVFPNYLTHVSPQNIIAPYLNSTSIAQTVNKPFLMFETNTASCGGFPGVSDSFGATLWALDYALLMASSNFSGALLHVGGIDDTYNPFNPPMTNQSQTRQWSIGSTFYSVVVAAETLGKSGNAQIIDLAANSGNQYTPGYGIYVGGSLSQVALFNYITDQSGASDYTATISVLGGTTPSQVSVKYLLAPSVAEKWNITWAGQTLGGQYESDGRFKGNESIQTVQCDTTAGTCAVKVPSPGFALVFMNNDALANSEPSSTVTFATTAVTKSLPSLVPASVLATAQGQNGADRSRLGSTSKGSSGASRSAGIYPSVAALMISVIGGLLLITVLRR